MRLSIKCIKWIRCNPVPFDVQHPRHNPKIFRWKRIIRQLHLQCSTKEIHNPRPNMRYQAISRTSAVLELGLNQICNFIWTAVNQVHNQSNPNHVGIRMLWHLCRGVISYLVKSIIHTALFNTQSTHECAHECVRVGGMTLNLLPVCGTHLGDTQYAA